MGDFHDVFWRCSWPPACVGSVGTVCSDGRACVLPRSSAVAKRTSPLDVWSEFLTEDPVRVIGR